MHFGVQDILYPATRSAQGVLWKSSIFGGSLCYRVRRKYTSKEAILHVYVTITDYKHYYYVWYSPIPSPPEQGLGKPKTTDGPIPGLRF